MTTQRTLSIIFANGMSRKDDILKRIKEMGGLTVVAETPLSAQQLQELLLNDERSRSD